MGIIDQTYQPWYGDLQPRYRRVAAMVRVGLSQAFAGTLIKLAALTTYTLVFGWVGFIFLISTVRAPGVDLGSLAMGNDKFRHFLGDFLPTGILVMMLAALVGGRCVTHDLRHNAVSMYLSKAITRWDYLAGKWATVAAFLLSATLVPGVFLWIADWALSREELTAGQRMGDLIAIAAGSLVLVGPIAAYVVALATLTRNAIVAGILWVLTYAGSWLVSAILCSAVDEEWCRLVSWPALAARLIESCFVLRPIKFAMKDIGPSPPTMEYGWVEPLLILGAISLLSAAAARWQLRKIERAD